MSGRVTWRREDGTKVTGYRKTDRRQAPRVPAHELPDFVLRYALPPQVSFAVAPGEAGILGVTVLSGGIVEARGKNRDWVLKQAGEFLGQVANGQEMIVIATLERGESPPATPEAPGRGAYKLTREMVYVPGPSVVYLSPLKKALVFAVKR